MMTNRLLRPCLLAALSAVMSPGCASDLLPAVQPMPPPMSLPEGRDGGMPADPPGCFSDSPAAARPALVFAAGLELRVLRSDGVSSRLFRFAEGALEEARQFIVNPVRARGDLVAAEASWARGPGGVAWREVVLVEVGGRVRWTLRRQGNELMWPELGPGGLSLFDADRQAIVIEPGGTPRTLPGLSPIGAPGLDRTLAVRPVDLERRTGFGFFHLDTGRFVALSLPLWADSLPQWAGGRLVYLGERGGRPVAVSERSGDARVAELAGIPDDPNTRVYLHVDQGQARIEVVGPPRQSLRFDPVTGQLTPIGGITPQGLRTWNGWHRGELDDQGSVLMALRGDYRGALYQAAKPGDPFVQLGGTVSEVMSLRAHGRAGTYVIVASNDTFVGETEWPMAPPGAGADLTGISVQVVRPSDAVARSFTGVPDNLIGNLSLRGDGRCGAYVGYGRDGAGVATESLHAYDVLADRDRLLLSGPHRMTAAAVTWIE